MRVGELARDKKAFSIRILDLRKLSTVTDFFVICSVDAEIQARAVADHIRDKLGEGGHKPWHTEGYRDSGWIVLDYIDFVVHIFLPPVREMYNLEQLWGDAAVQEVPDDDEARMMTDSGHEKIA